MNAHPLFRGDALVARAPGAGEWLTGLAAAAVSIALWSWITRSPWVAAMTLFWCLYTTAGLRLARETVRARIGLAVAFGGFSAAAVHFLLHR